MNWSRFPRPSRRQPRPIALSFFLVLAAAAVLTTASTSPSPGTPQEELGRLLFWDPVLSGPMDVSCATCHHPDFAYADGRALSLGPGAVGLGPDRVDLAGGVIPVAQRNSPTLLNVAYNGLDRQRRRRRGPRFTPLPADLETVNSERAPMFWDRRARSLETQALLPLTIREEMRGDAYPEEVAVDSVVARLREIPEYVNLFREVYGEETSIDATQVAQAIAAFERTLIAGNSPFDRFLAGDGDALTTQQRRGPRRVQRGRLLGLPPRARCSRTSTCTPREWPRTRSWPSPTPATGASASAPRPCATSRSPRPTCTTA